jgi:23S rRNA pseudouridine2605 synthase
MRKRIDRNRPAGREGTNDRPSRGRSRDEREKPASSDAGGLIIRPSNSNSGDAPKYPSKRGGFGENQRGGFKPREDGDSSQRRTARPGTDSGQRSFERRERSGPGRFGNREGNPGERSPRSSESRAPYGERRRPGSDSSPSREPSGDRKRPFSERKSFGSGRNERPSFGSGRPTRERPDRPFRSDRTENTERPERVNRAPWADKVDRPDRTSRTGRSERPFRSDRTERPGRPDRSGKTESRRDYSFNGGERPNYRPFKPADKKRPGRKTLTEGPKTIRLNKYIADSGVCSRREADELIKLGEVKVNGKTITEMGYQVNPSDTVKYGNRTLSREKMVYLLMNKPKDFITTLDDPEGRKTVVDILGNHVKERVYPVGRLDRNTTGLLLLTNDGELADKLSHPSNNIKKIYQVELDQPISKEDVQKLRDGVVLEDGPASIDHLELLEPNAQVIGLELHSGRNRIVRRLFEHLGYKVTKLDRVMYAELTKKDLPRGAWRHLTEKEVIRLKYFI